MFPQMHRFWTYSSSYKNIGFDRNHDISDISGYAINCARIINCVGIIDR